MITFAIYVSSPELSIKVLLVMCLLLLIVKLYFFLIQYIKVSSFY